MTVNDTAQTSVNQAPCVDAMPKHVIGATHKRMILQNILFILIALFVTCAVIPLPFDSDNGIAHAKAKKKHVKKSNKKAVKRTPPRQASIVIDARDGRILHAVNIDASVHPASLTKMMTLYLMFDALESGRVNLNDRAVISSRAAAQKPTKIGLPAGASIRIEDGIYAIVTKSANDVTVAFAEKLAGSESAFVTRMNRTARGLGMTGTRFMNSNGLPNSAQITTARDMAVLSVALIKNHPRYYRYFATRDFTFRGQTIHNHNRLLDNYPGLDGIKTGYVNASGFNLAASAVRSGTRLVGVVFGGTSWASRNETMARLLDNGFISVQRPATKSAHYITDGYRQKTVEVAGDVPEAKSKPTPVMDDTEDGEDAVPVQRATKTATGAAMIDALANGEETPVALPTVQAPAVPRGKPAPKPVSDVVILPPAVPASPSLQNRSTPIVDERTPVRTVTRTVQMRPVGVDAHAAGAGASVMQLRNPSRKPQTSQPPLEDRPAAPAQDNASGGSEGAGWVIQIGAFTALDQAQSALMKAQSRLPAELRRGTRILTLVDSTGQTLYGARLGSYTSDETQSACQYLSSCVILNAAQ